VSFPNYFLIILELLAHYQKIKKQNLGVDIKFKKCSIFPQSIRNKNAVSKKWFYLEVSIISLILFCKELKHSFSQAQRKMHLLFSFKTKKLLKNL
jgi:hypothetical protein